MSNLGWLIPKVNHREEVRQREHAPLHDLETAKGVFYDRHNTYGTHVPEFYVLLVKLLDKALTNFNLHHLSAEQERLTRRYLELADTLTRKHTSAWNQDYVSEDDAFLQDIWKDVGWWHFILSYNEQYKELFDELPLVFEELDNFLGSYYGVDYGRYNEYGKEQLHCKRKLASSKTKVTHRAQF